MGYVGPSLAHLFELDREVRELCESVAEEGGHRMTDHVRELTPVGHAPFQEGYVPGHLLASILKKILVVTFEVGGMVYESGTETNVDYAPYVENGTGLWGPARAMYEIRPKNPNGWLRFHDKDGRVVFAKRVMHPGSPGAHMFTKGAARTEEGFEEWGRARLERWCVEQEARIEVRAREVVLVS